LLSKFKAVLLANVVMAAVLEIVQDSQFDQLKAVGWVGMS